ncbi:hypothetical protein HCJ93_08175 [Streptomyces sp. SBST2-5]|uniref:Uncharacterized protein n=1 Tax=Streptomyces composti TaxID=2720025 RepID=A0ABX1A621_9ACTN|nr:hypothetical protein [Streptomyces composti]NJP50049.1 hypothetical protein [Streptomyces composti]
MVHQAVPGVWLPGYEEQRHYWEGMFIEMTERCLRHRAWVAERQRPGSRV